MSFNVKLVDAVQQCECFDKCSGAGWGLVTRLKPDAKLTQTNICLSGQAKPKTPMVRSPCSGTICLGLRLFLIQFVTAEFKRSLDCWRYKSTRLPVFCSKNHPTCTQVPCLSFLASHIFISSSRLSWHLAHQLLPSYESLKSLAGSSVVSPISKLGTLARRNSHQTISYARGGLTKRKQIPTRRPSTPFAPTSLETVAIRRLQFAQSAAAAQ